jgi:type I restriction enzyme S subunit
MQIQKIKPGYKDPRFDKNPYQLPEIPKEWEYVKLGDTGTFSNGVNKPSEAFGHGTLFVNLMDVYENININTRRLDRVEVTNNELRRYALKQGDILLVRSSVKQSGVGYPAYFEHGNEPIVFSGFIIRFRPDFNKWNYKFLTYLLQSSSIRSNVIAYSTISANTNINQE